MGSNLRNPPPEKKTPTPETTLSHSNVEDRFLQLQYQLDQLRQQNTPDSRLLTHPQPNESIRSPPIPAKPVSTARNNPLQEEQASHLSTIISTLNQLISTPNLRPQEPLHHLSPPISSQSPENTSALILRTLQSLVSGQTSTPSTPPQYSWSLQAAPIPPHTSGTPIIFNLPSNLPANLPAGSPCLHQFQNTAPQHHPMVSPFQPPVVSNPHQQQLSNLQSWTPSHHLQPEGNPNISYTLTPNLVQKRFPSDF
jgi:hypothetical protein